MSLSSLKLDYQNKQRILYGTQAAQATRNSAELQLLLCMPSVCKEFLIVLVIPPFLRGLGRRIYAAIFSFWAGVIPPLPMLGRS